MSARMNEKNIVECLFEDIPSDSDTFTSYDDSEADETYLPNKDVEVMEVNHLSDDTMNQNDDELVEILNLDEGNVLLLPSPIKTRHSKRQTHLKNNHTNSNICRPLFPPINQEQYYQSTETTELENNIVETNQPENTLIHTYENETSTNSFEFTIPTWSKNNDFSQEPLPDFTCADGPTTLIDIEAEHTPFSIFQLLFSNDILDLIVYQTNLYAYQIKMKTGKSYIPTDTNEIMTFLGMNILMGIKRDPSYRDYWSTCLDLHDDYISSLMTVNRFGWLLSSLHLNDNSVMAKRGETDYDKLYKVQPFLKKIKDNFQKYYLPHKIIAVDESMIKFKGRSTLKQYMPKKPIKRGYKVWSLADKHGYLWNFDLYTGKRGDSVETNLGGRVVKDLTKPLQHKNHNLYIDNFFTSVPLLAYLKSKGIFCCGTVNSTRKYLPKLESDKKMVMGDIDWNMSDQYHISIVKWKDKRGVTLLSNFHNPTDVVEVKRKSKDGTTSMIPCPSVLKEYNMNMNCVDKFDQYKKMYHIDRKSHKWWHRIFFFFFDAAIVNSHIIYTKITGEKITLKNFRREISKSLVSKTFVQKRRQKGSGSPSPISIKRASVSPSVRKDQSAHQPERTTRRRCAHCSTKEKEVRTDWKCTICDVPLCISKSRNCFNNYHSC